MYSVYEITNMVNGKKYIGITSRSIEERFQEHISRAKAGMRNNRLYIAMRKYGIKSFVVRNIMQTTGEDEVRELETKYINKCDSYKNGYNCNLGGHGFLTFPDEIKKKISAGQIGKVISMEARAKMSTAKIGDSSCSKHFGKYIMKGKNSPLSKFYLIQFPDGHKEVIRGLRAFCRANNLMHCKMSAHGKTKGFVLLERFNDYPEREYGQAAGSAHLPVKVEDIV